MEEKEHSGLRDVLGRGRKVSNEGKIVILGLLVRLK